MRLKGNRMLKDFFHREDGTILVLVAFSFVILIGMLGLVIDSGFIYMEKSNLKKAATMAVLSGGQELPNNDARVKDVVNHILTSYGDQDHLVSLVHTDKTISVTLENYVPHHFMKIFGLDGTNVQATASAAIAPIGEAVGVTPLGVNQSVDLVYGETYELKVGAGDAETGNFGILALQGPGANIYRDNLMYGYQEPLKVGDIIQTQTGNIAGATEEGVNYRIGLCPNPSAGSMERDCARIMRIIVYEPLSSSEIKVTGFAFFYLLNPMSDTDTTIKGIFIKRVDTGTYVDSGLDRGAYTIKLTR